MPRSKMTPIEKGWGPVFDFELGSMDSRYIDPQAPFTTTNAILTEQHLALHPYPQNPPFVC